MRLTVEKSMANLISQMDDLNANIDPEKSQELSKVVEALNEATQRANFLRAATKQLTEEKDSLVSELTNKQAALSMFIQDIEKEKKNSQKLSLMLSELSSQYKRTYDQVKNLEDENLELAKKEALANHMLHRSMTNPQISSMSQLIDFTKDKTLEEQCKYFYNKSLELYGETFRQDSEVKKVSFNNISYKVK